MAKRAAGVVEDVHRLGGAQDKKVSAPKVTILTWYAVQSPPSVRIGRFSEGSPDSARSTGTTIA